MNGVMVAVDRVRSLAGGPRSGFECVAQPHPDDVGLRVAGEGLPQWIFLQRNVANLQRLEVHTPRECACRRGTFHFPQHSPQRWLFYLSATYHMLPFHAIPLQPSQHIPPHPSLHFPSLHRGDHLH